jgi:predicted lipoprotein with Yx(FWY)xxD motif
MPGKTVLARTGLARTVLARTVVSATLTAAVLALATGCASASGTASVTAGTAPAAKGGPAVTVDAHSVPGVGTVLVTSAGYALYMFAPDNHRTVTCTGACAGTWPPLTVKTTEALVAGHGVRQSLLGTDPDPGGSARVVTYDGWPLYTYTGDVQPDQATGQNVDLNGGEWYVIRPSGQPLIPAP